MYTLDECMVCGETQRTIVAEYNRLIFTDNMWNSDLARFDYALCHGCGLVYATRRPERGEYDFLYENFNEFLIRRPAKGQFNVPQLSDELRDQIDREFLPWWEIRDAPTHGFPIRKRLRHDLYSALRYLPYLERHVPLKGAKVLQIRAKGSTLADLLRRRMGADKVDVITLFPAHTYLAEKNPGIRAVDCLDYENFRIPFEEKYNLIIENHIFLHMLDASRTFEVFTSHLDVDGHLLLQGELDDDLLFRKRKNLFAELRPFHYQHFDKPTLKRILCRYGYETILLTGLESEGDPELCGVAKLAAEPTERPRIATAELKDRLAMYAQWRDESIVSLPKQRFEALYGSEREQLWERLRQRGSLKLSASGKPVGVRRFAEAQVPDSELEIAAAFGKGRVFISTWVAEGIRRTGTANWLARRLQGTRTASWLARRLRGTRAADWIEARVIAPGADNAHRKNKKVKVRASERRQQHAQE